MGLIAFMRDVIDRLVQAGFLPLRDAKRILLHLTAKTFIGTDASPNDIAPDEYGCAETLNEIHRAAFGDYISSRNILSTYWMYADLKKRSDFVSVNVPTPGDIIISPTGYGGYGGITNGHVGVVTDGGWVLSNDSFKGTWEKNYTLETWRDRYERRGGYPVRFFRKV